MATAAPRRYHRPRRGEHLDLGVRGGEGEDHPAQGGREEQGACEVGLDEHPRPAAQVEQRPRCEPAPRDEEHQRHDGGRTDRREPAPVTGERDEQPAPREVAHQGRRPQEDDGPARHGRDEEEQAHQRRHGAVPRDVRSWRGQRPDGRCEDEPDGEVDREDRAPVGEGEDRGAEERAQHGPDLLDGRDDPERDAAALRGIEVGDQGQCRRHQAATADALEEAAGDDAGHVVGQRRDQAAEGEEHERHHQDRHPAAEVGDPADQGQHRDVAQQEAADDRRGPLELVDRHPDAGHHVRQRQDHDVGVGGGEGDGDRRHREEQPRGARDLRLLTHAHGAAISCSMP